MPGREFIRRVRKFGRKRGLSVKFVASEGKGDHGALYLGGRKTIVADMRKDLRPGTVRAMCQQLGIDVTDL